MDVRVGAERKLSAKELMLLSYGAEKTLESPLNCKEIKPVKPKRNKSWIFIGKTDAEAEALILWPPDVKSQLTRQGPDAGKDWRQEEKETTEDKMVGWHRWLKGLEFALTLGYTEGQGSLVCCSPWVTKSQTWLSNWSGSVNNEVANWELKPRSLPFHLLRLY